MGNLIEPLRFRRAPLLAAACWLALGMAMARSWQPAVVLLAAVTLVLALAVVALQWSPRVAVAPVAVLWVIAGFWCWQLRPVPSSQTTLMAYADGLSRQVRGRVVRVRELSPRTSSTDQDSDPAWWIEREPDAAAALSVDVQVEAVEEVTPDVSRMVPAEGGVRATALARNAPLPFLQCGDLVEAPMILKVPERYHDPGAWQYADYLLEQGIGVHATVRAPNLHVVEKGSPTLRCRLYAAQSWASARMVGFVRSSANRRLPRAMRLTEDDAGMLNAMLFGDRARLNHALRMGFERTGTFHLFVVSGMHVALLAGMVFWLALRMRLREWLATLATLAVTFAYALLTGFGAPVQRALFMTAVFLIARLLSRERSVLNALGASALAVLVLSPASLAESSFQMTFLVIIAIGGIAVPLGEQSFLPYARAAENIDETWRDQSLHPSLAQFRVMLRLWGEALEQLVGPWARHLPARLMRASLWAAELALIGVVAEMVMSLPMAVYFHRATLFALPANMLTVPIIVVLAPLAIGTFCAVLASPWLAMVPAALTSLLLHSIRWVIGHVSHLHAADVRTPAPVWWVAALALAVWGFCCWAARRSRGWTLVAAVMLPVVAAMILWPEPQLVTRGQLEVTALDVGQGDSLLVVSPEGRTMLVDAGGPVGGVTETAAAVNGFDVGEEVVSPYLWSRRIRRLDVLVLSHAHSDHMGGMAAVMGSFRPRELWVSIDPDSEAYRSLLDEARELGVVVKHLRAGDARDWGGAQVSVLAPEADYRNAGQPVNNDSLVLRVQYGAGSVLLEGDAETPSEQAMIAERRVTPVTLLKIGHHGSRTSTTADFLAAARPKDTVVSVGRQNTFGHPRFEVIERVAESGARLYRTDEFGVTTFLLSHDGRIREVLGAGD
ncbi:MAG TPA: ComEC/Rec2 family competence protein [Edaphobacter sp.]